MQGGKFCPECGATIATKKKCASCGAEADGAPKFCPECGKPYGA
jgi:membrane protease subunit (stomatin/prohibitin family)